MSVPTFSWVRALEEGVLTDMQLETLQAAVDNGDADTLSKLHTCWIMKRRTPPGKSRGRWRTTFRRTKEMEGSLHPSSFSTLSTKTEFAHVAHLSCPAHRR